MKTEDKYEIRHILEHENPFITLKKYHTKEANINNLYTEYHIGTYTVQICRFYQMIPHVHHIKCHDCIVILNNGKELGHCFMGKQKTSMDNEGDFNYEICGDIDVYHTYLHAQKILENDPWYNQGR